MKIEEAIAKIRADPGLCLTHESWLSLSCFTAYFLHRDGISRTISCCREEGRIISTSISKGETPAFDSSYEEFFGNGWVVIPKPKLNPWTHKAKWRENEI